MTCHCGDRPTGPNGGVLEYAPTGRWVTLDPCIAHVIKYLWQRGHQLCASCCGHNRPWLKGCSLVLDTLDDAEAIRKDLAWIDERKWRLLRWELVEQ